MYRIAGATSSGPSRSGRSSAAGGHRLTRVTGAAILAVFATVNLNLRIAQERELPAHDDTGEQALQWERSHYMKRRLLLLAYAIESGASWPLIRGRCAIGVPSTKSISICNEPCKSAAMIPVGGPA